MTNHVSFELFHATTRCLAASSSVTFSSKKKKKKKDFTSFGQPTTDESCLFLIPQYKFPTAVKHF